jgi:hypothetical protein
LLKERFSLRIFKDILSPENVTVSNKMRKSLRVSSKDKKMVDQTFLWVGLLAGSVCPEQGESWETCQNRTATQLKSELDTFQIKVHSVTVTATCLISV